MSVVVGWIFAKQRSFPAV